MDNNDKIVEKRINHKENGKFAHGNCANPTGRPKKPEIEALRKAVKAVEKDKDKTLLRHFVEQAYEDKNVLVALMKKFLPDLKAVDNVLMDPEGNSLQIVVTMKNIESPKNV